LNRTRWIQFGVVLAIAFVLSVGAGALIGRQRSAPPVASVPTPTPALTATPSSAPPTPTPAPTQTATPGPATTPPTLPPSATPSAAPLDPPTAEDFADDLLIAFQSGDTAYLFDRLHPLVFERYGERQCRRYVNQELQPDPAASWTVLSSSGPAPWAWETDGLTTTVNDTWTVNIEIPDEGQREVHFAPSDGTWRWFADCGVPR
jgi:hypothetical protein